jgi:hypothetical protein
LGAATGDAVDQAPGKEKTMNEETRPVSDPATHENARVGYRVAVDLWTYQGNLNWNRFNVMLAANSIILSVIGVVLSSQSFLPVFEVLFPAIGIVLCIVWAFLMVRGFDYHKYWSSQARELEEEYLSDVVKIVSDAWMGFKLTMQSLEALRNEGVPDKILKDLEPLAEARFTSKRKFLRAVKKQIRKEQTKKYKKSLLKHAKSGKVEYSRLSRLGGSQRKSIYLVIFAFAAVYIVVAVLRIL